tara:strand:+ start:585 stop:1421 length:837 start_codon:yes stop_codon:yes gene_type:complete
LNDSTTRGLFGIASGGISISNGYGKSNQFAFSITSSQTNANLRTLAVNAGWNQSSSLLATINSGVVMTSNSVGTPGLTINGSFPGGVELVNNGTIVGDGGNGGKGGDSAFTGQSVGLAGSAGGLALTISVAASIRNNGTIAGGGGGGGGAGGWRLQTSGGKDAQYSNNGGGGGGGGRSSLTNSSGGSKGLAYSNPAGVVRPGFAGGAGTFNAAGAGGNGGFSGQPRGGNGGGWGAGGAAGTKYSSGANGGGGGGAGAATSGQANVTWLATGTRLGSLG